MEINKWKLYHIIVNVLINCYWIFYFYIRTISYFFSINAYMHELDLPYIKFLK